MSIFSTLKSVGNAAVSFISGSSKKVSKAVTKPVGKLESNIAEHLGTKSAEKLGSKSAEQLGSKANDALEAQGRAMLKKYQKPELQGSAKVKKYQKPELQVVDLEKVKMENPKLTNATSSWNPGGSTGGGMGGEQPMDAPAAPGWGEISWE